MKKFFKGALSTLAFALAFLAVGVGKVNAAEAELKESINNTKIDEKTANSFVSEENSYYVTRDGNIKLIAKSNSSKGFFGVGAKTYYARVSVVKCEDYNNGVCRKWNVYNYSNDGATTMDALSSGLTIDLKNLEYTNTATSEEPINNQTLGQLNSIYGVQNTYFAIVQYYQSNWQLFGEKDTYAPEIYRLVLRSDITETTVSHTMGDNGVAKFVVKSGTPITNVRYFASATKLEGQYDYASKFADNSGVEVLSEASANPISSNGVFSYEFEVTLEEGKYYYINAEDVSGDNVIYDANEEIGKNYPKDGDDKNIADTYIGKVILISLLVLLVISVVLVIVQKIVDHRRKLY